MSKVVYVVKVGGKYLIGTAQWVHDARKAIGVLPGYSGGECVGMFAGTDDDAHVARERFAPRDGWYAEHVARESAHFGVPFAVDGPELRDWLRTLDPWDGTNSKLMGIAGLGKNRPAKQGSLADRVASRSRR